jgi:cation diffusion facilitator family transporter
VTQRSTPSSPPPYPGLLDRWLGHVPPAESRAILVSISVGVALLGVKFAAYFATGSPAIFADALEGVVNVTASSFALYALVMAHRPADVDHPYGHGKIEFFSAGAEGGMILLAAAVSTVKAVDALVRPHLSHESHLGVGLGLMGVATAANAVVGAYLIRRGRSRRSLVLEADGWHLMSDVITSGVAIGALLLVRATGWGWADPVAAVVVSAYIAWAGVGLIRRSAAGLMDEQDARDTVVIRGILDAHCGPAGHHPQVCSYHKLRHRHSGRYHWVDFHLVVPGTWDIETGHRVASAIEWEIEQALEEGNATAHVEPCPEPECAGCPTDPPIAPPVPVGRGATADV